MIFNSLMILGALFSTGDVIAQTVIIIHYKSKKKLENKKEIKYDYKRVARNGLFGLCICGPAVCHWYKLINRYSLSTPLKSKITHQNSFNYRHVGTCCCRSDCIRPLFLGVYLTYHCALDFLLEKKINHQLPSQVPFSRMLDDKLSIVISIIDK